MSKRRKKEHVSASSGLPEEIHPPTPLVPQNEALPPTFGTEVRGSCFGVDPLGIDPTADSPTISSASGKNVPLFMDEDGETVTVNNEDAQAACAEAVRSPSHAADQGDQAAAAHRKRRQSAGYVEEGESTISTDSDAEEDQTSQMYSQIAGHVQKDNVREMGPSIDSGAPAAVDDEQMVDTGKELPESGEDTTNEAVGQAIEELRRLLETPLDYLLQASDKLQPKDKVDFIFRAEQLRKHSSN